MRNLESKIMIHGVDRLLLRRQIPFVGIFLGGLLLVCLPLAAAVAVDEGDPRLQEPMEELSERPEAPDFTLTDIYGRTFTLSEHRGKWVFVHFWSIYCPHCTREISTLEQMYEAYRSLKEGGGIESEVEWAGVNFGEEREKIEEWAKANNLELDAAPEEDVHFVLLDEGKTVTKSWRIFGLPSSFFIDPEGRIALQAIGERNWRAPAIREQLQRTIP
jgi:peroxiredoxin